MEELPLPEKGCQVPFYRAQALPHFCVTAWVFLPDPSADGHWSRNRLYHTQFA
jgi:hypothetical protein